MGCFVQGHALYYGRAQLADDYFEKMGYSLPYRVNVADFILDLASGDVSIEGRCSSFWSFILSGRTELNEAPWRVQLSRMLSP